MTIVDRWRERLTSILEGRSRLTAVVDVVTDTYIAWRNDRTIRLGAGLAYYGLFSIASMLTLTLAATQLLVSGDDIRRYLSDWLLDVFGEIGPEAAATISEGLDGVTAGQLGLVGGISLLITGSLFFIALEDALNMIWGQPVRVGIRSSIRRRIVGFIVVFAAGLTVVASLTVQAISSFLEALVPGQFPGIGLVASALGSALSWTVLWAAIVLLFRYLPSVDVPWRTSIIGGGATSVLLVVGTAAIGWYLRTFGASSISGAVSSVLAVLAWIFYEAQMVLIGAQFTRTLTQRAGLIELHDDAS